MGADGSLFAIRRSLHRPPPDDMFDDVYVSMMVLCQGYRLVQAADVNAFEESVPEAREEFQRKIRIGCQAFNARARLRLYPARPKVGLRTQAPNEAWHVDVTILKLLDGTKAYVHAVIDNFSRRILAWTVADHLDPMKTRDVLTTAAANLEASTKTDVFMDSGVENLNGDGDALFEANVLQRVIAQIDVSFSNSLIEAWWRSLKHQWLFLHQLDNIATVKKLVEFYVTEHNQRMPHSAFQGQTPDEMYFGRATQLPEELAVLRQAARQQRVAHNRSVTCAVCPRDARASSDGIAA
jgi:putative transposase